MNKNKQRLIRKLAFLHVSDGATLVQRYDAKSSRLFTMVDLNDVTAKKLIFAMKCEEHLLSKTSHLPDEVNSILLTELYKALFGYNQLIRANRIIGASSSLGGDKNKSKSPHFVQIEGLSIADSTPLFDRDEVLTKEFIASASYLELLAIQLGLEYTAPGDEDLGLAANIF